MLRIKGGEEKEICGGEIGSSIELYYCGTKNDTDKDIGRHRLTDRQTNKQAHRQTDSNRERKTDSGTRSERH